MIDSIFLRLFWKEYRVQRGFWLSVGGIAIFCQLLVLCLPEQYAPHLPWLFGLALGVPAFYALGCGATMFAGEREEGTLEQLRVLGAPGSTVWWSKLSFGVVSTVALTVALLVLAINLGRGQWPPPGELQTTFNVGGVAAFEFLAYGIFFSLITKRPLNAACMAAVAELMNAAVAALIVDISFRRPADPASPVFWATVHFVRFLLALFVLSVDAVIALWWVLDRPARWHVLKTSPQVRSELDLVQRRAVIASGVAFLAASAFPALVATLWLLFMPAPWRFARLELWKLWGLAAIDGLVWGVFFALVTRRTAVAAIGAAVAAFLQCQLLAWLVHALFGGGWRGEFAPWFAAIPSRLLLDIAVLAVDCWLALRWTARHGVGVVNAPRAVELSGRAPSAARRLVWQERRQAWKTMLVFVGLAILLRLSCNHSLLARDVESLTIAVVFAAILASTIGSCVFLAEQEGGRFRFLADHGVSARRVWLTKHLVWGPFALAVVVAFLVVCLRRPVLASPTGGDAFAVALVPVIAYSAGQLASMLIARGVVAGAIGLFITVPLLLWELLMHGMGLSLWWSVVPVPIVLLFATWVRAPDWLLERRDWRAWLRLIAVLGVPAIALKGAVAAYRVYEIPGGGPGFSVDEVLRPATSDERETAQLYRRAIDALNRGQWFKGSPEQGGAPLVVDDWDSTPDWLRDWLAENGKALELTRRASARPSCVLYEPNEIRFDSALADVESVGLLARLLALEARRLESEGELDAALDCYIGLARMAQHVASRGGMTQYGAGYSADSMVYEALPHWAAHPDQTSDRIRTALRRLDDVYKNAPQLSESIQVEYTLVRRVLTTDLEELAAASGDDKSVAAAVLAKRFLPFELVRALRLMDYRTALSLHYAAEVQAALARGVPVPMWPGANGRTDLESERLARWQATTPWPASPHVEYWGAREVEVEEHRRVLRLILAIKAWQVDHGELPASLDLLVGEYFERLPLNPWTAAPFGYLPRGFDKPVRFASPSKFVSKPGQPLLWMPNDPRGVAVRIKQTGTTRDGQPIFEATGELGGSAFAGSVTAVPIP